MLLGTVLGAVLAAAGGCAEQPVHATLPVTTIATAAGPHYSLLAVDDAEPGDWLLVYADRADFALKIVRGTSATIGTGSGRATGDTNQALHVTVVDRVDVPPGANAAFGAHAVVVREGIRHLFYSDQELPEVRVTKWVQRPVGSAQQWQVDLLAGAPIPVMAFATASGLGLYARSGGDGQLVSFAIDGERVQGPVAADSTDQPAALLAGTFNCTGRHGVVLRDGTQLQLVEPASPRRSVVVPADGPVAVGCHQAHLLVAYTRPDPGTAATSARELLDAREIVVAAVPADEGGAYLAAGREVKVTLARQVTALAVATTELALATGAAADVAASPAGLPRPAALPGAPAAAQPDGARVADLPAGLLLVYSELAVSGEREIEYHLSLIAPRAGGGYIKQVLLRGQQPVSDLQLLQRGSELIVAFRRDGLRLVRVQLASDDAPPGP